MNMPDDDAVRILTIHGSKGLEFPIVVLAGLGTRGTDIGPWVRWGTQRPELAVGGKDRRFQTEGFEELSQGVAAAERHEGHRLLYVAATRARDHLVVSLHHPEAAKQSHAHVLADVTPAMRAYHEETFGPVAVLVRGQGRGGNGAHCQRYALRVVGRRRLAAMSTAPSGSASRDGYLPHQWTDRARRGADAPGRVKASGCGRFGGKAAIAEFTELHGTTTQSGDRHYPFRGGAPGRNGMGARGPRKGAAGTARELTGQGVRRRPCERRVYVARRSGS